MKHWLKLVAMAFAAALAGCNPPALEPRDEPAFLAPPLGLPPVTAPADNPATKARVELGRKLFMDRRLSHNQTISCGMCHVPEQGFTSNDLGTAVGMEGRSVRRNSPTLYNVAYSERLFHDGREISLENQVWGPLLALNEMANPSIGYVMEKIRSLPDYADAFEAAFGGRGPTMQTIGQALASYQRTLQSGNSRFDRWRYGKEDDAVSAEEQEGFRLFTGKAGCGVCHAIGEQHALFTDNKFHNTGIGYARSMGLKTSHRVQLAPDTFTEVKEEDTVNYSEPRQNDVGRFEVTEEPADRWAYKTPALRNVALTGPYMHDGSLATLEEVVEFYDRGGIENEARDPSIGPLKLNAAEKKTLVAFLKTLTGDNVERLAAEARRAMPNTYKAPGRQEGKICAARAESPFPF